jgi:hypothetical protein
MGKPKPNLPLQVGGTDVDAQHDRETVRLWPAVHVIWDERVVAQLLVDADGFIESRK